MTHKQSLITAGKRRAYVDSGIVIDIIKLWRAGVDTRASCQGYVDRDDFDEWGVNRYVLLERQSDVRQACELLPWVNAVVINRPAWAGAVVYAHP